MICSATMNKLADLSGRSARSDDLLGSSAKVSDDMSVCFPGKREAEAERNQGSVPTM